MDQNDLDLIARTIVGEASNQPPEGQQAVANVILNRLNSGKFGKSASDVVLAPYQFEPWQTRKAELQAIRPESPAYQSALRALTAAQTGDVTGGATHFLEPTIVRQRRGGTLPNWAQGPSTKIGDHLFFTPDGGGPGRVAQNSAPPAMSTNGQNAPFSPPAAASPGQPKSDSLASAFALLAPEPEDPAMLEMPAPQQVSGPFDMAEDVDTSAFRPRTTMRGRGRKPV